MNRLVYVSYFNWLFFVIIFSLFGIMIYLKGIDLPFHFSVVFSINAYCVVKFKYHI